MEDTVIVHAKHGDFIIDKEDLSKIQKYKWVLTDNGKGHLKFQGHLPNEFRHLVSIPQVIFGQPAPRGFYYDHVDRDIFNNRKSNFRLATPRENGRNLTQNPHNTSGFTGVYRYTTRSGRVYWRASIHYNTSVHLGDYAELVDACWARWVGEWIVYREFRNPKNAQRLWTEGIKSEHKDEIYGRVLDIVWRQILPRIEAEQKKEDP